MAMNYSNTSFLEWAKEVTRIAGQIIDIKDPNWFFCYDDGLEPIDAYKEAVSAGVIKAETT